MVARISLSQLLYKMLRLRTALLILLFVAIADAASKPVGQQYDWRLIIVGLVLAAWYIFGTSVNDLADEAIDQVNLKGNPNRPLINQETSRRRLWGLTAVAMTVTLGASTILGSRAILISLGALGLSYVYSMPPIKLSYRGFLAPLLLPIGYVAYPFGLVFIANHATFTTSDWLLLAALYISFMGRIILKDFRDVKGDRQFGKRTFLVRYGAVWTCAVSAMAWVVGYVLIAWRFRDWPWLGVAVLPFVVGVWYFLRLLARSKTVSQQVQYVGLIGRLANGTALLVLTALYYELNPDKTSLYTWLLLAMTLFNLHLAYAWYRPLIDPELKKLRAVL